MTTAALDIVDVRRVALALGVSTTRVLQAAAELGLIEHRINGQPFISAADEDRIRRHVSTATGGMQITPHP